MSMETKAVTAPGNAPETDSFIPTYDHQEATALAYVRGIRNEEKRRYAQGVFDYIVHRRPSYLDKEYNLSAMGKQAVHMRLREIFNA